MPVRGYQGSTATVSRRTAGRAQPGRGGATGLLSMILRVVRPHEGPSFITVGSARFLRFEMKSSGRDDERNVGPCDGSPEGEGDDLLVTDLPLFPIPGPLLRLSATRVVPSAPEQWVACDSLPERAIHPGVSFGLFRVRLL